MNPADLRLVPDTARFAFDTVDGETVAIDTVSGSLYLLTGIGPWIWESLTRRSAAADLVSAVESRFGADAGAEVRGFLTTLAEHGMLIAGDDAAAAVPAGAGVPEVPSDYRAPGVEKFDEIADIIAMDPIHDVDPARGWPHSN